MPAKCVCKLPDAIDFDTGAAMMLKGLTAQYLLKRTLPQGGLKEGDFVLFHAAAGGVGLIACQWARALGLQLIGTAGSDAKCALAKEHGAAHVINYAKEDFLARVQGDHRRQGREGGVRLGGQGHLGQVARLPAAVRPDGLLRRRFGRAVRRWRWACSPHKGSIYVTRQTLFSHIATRESTQAMADDLFAAVTSGKVKIHIDQRYPLEQVQQAHRDLEARKTTGCTILTL